MATPLIPTGQRERRIYKLDRIELRMSAAGAPILDGHAAVFNSDSEPMYGFTERVKPGCFARALKEDDVRGLFNHDANLILGRNIAKTMRLAEDDKGLAFEIDLPDTSYAKDLSVSIGRGDVTGCSFSFRTIKDEWEYSPDGSSAMRTLIDVELYDVGPVTFPAYPATDVSLRSMEEIVAEGKRRLDADKPKGADPAVMRRKLELSEIE